MTLRREYIYEEAILTKEFLYLSSVILYTTSRPF